MTAGRSSERRPGRRLDRSFFDRPTERVARSLLGCLLTVVAGRDRRTVRIVETEAYVADDPANHAYRGLTARNRSMFAPPGTLYVYRIHRVVCANLVTRPGEAVLLRAGAPVRPGLGPSSGPGRLCRSLGVTIRDDGADAAVGPRVFVGLPPRPAPRIVTGPRVGIRRAAERPLRFAVEGDPFVSRPRPTRSRRSSGAWPTRNRVAAAKRRTRTTRRRPSAGGRSGGRTGGR